MDEANLPSDAPEKLKSLPVFVIEINVSGPKGKKNLFEH